MALKPLKALSITLGSMAEFPSNSISRLDMSSLEELILTFTTTSVYALQAKIIQLTQRLNPILECQSTCMGDGVLPKLKALRVDSEVVAVEGNLIDQLGRWKPAAQMEREVVLFPLLGRERFQLRFLNEGGRAFYDSWSREEKGKSGVLDHEE